MKRIILLLVCLLSLSMVFAAFDKNESDRLFYVENDYEADFAYLTKSLQSAVTNEEKAEILWRMSRTRLTLTDENKERPLSKIDFVIGVATDTVDCAQLSRLVTLSQVCSAISP